MKVGVWSPSQAETDGGGSVFELELVEAIRGLHDGVGFEFDLGYVPPDYRPVAPPNGESPSGPAAEPDLVYYPSAFGAVVDIPYIATVWDLQYRRQPCFPEVSASGEWEAREARHATFLRRAAAVIVPNEVGKKEACHYFSLDEENVHCLPHPTPQSVIDAAERFKSDPPPRPPSAPKRGFLIYPAQFWPHKNHYVLIRALSILRSRGAKVDLVCPGDDKGNLDYVRELATALGLERSVHFPGFVPKEELLALYHHSEMLVYPSLFGPENLPPLEAFALGKPVVVSDYAGAREQFGDLARICDRYSPEAWAREIGHVVEDRSRPRLEEAAEFARSRSVGQFLDGVLGILERLERSRRTWRNSHATSELKPAGGFTAAIRKPSGRPADRTRPSIQTHPRFPALNMDQNGEEKDKATPPKNSLGLRFWFWRYKLIQTILRRKSRYHDNKPTEAVRSADPVWLSPKHWRQLVVFVHVPKAAGTSINDALWQIYGNTFRVQHERLSANRRADLTQEQADRILALSGHYRYGFHRSFGPPAPPGQLTDGLFAGREIKYVSVVREPAERLYSYYRYVTSFTAHRLYAITKGLGCYEFFALMDEIQNRECRNLQFAMVSGGCRSFREGIQLIDRNYLAVVPIHGVSELLAKMERELDWPQGRVQMNRKNRSPERSDDEEMAFLRDYARKNCPLDYGLYEHVMARFEEEFGKPAPGGA